MADVTIPYAQPGIAAFQLTDEYLNTILLRGSLPALSELVSGAAGAEIRRFQPVGFNASGLIVPATWNATPANAIKAIGIASEAIALGGRSLYWYTGHFNMDVLDYDSSFDTDAKKLAAFNGSPTPTAIRVSPRFG